MAFLHNDPVACQIKSFIKNVFGFTPRHLDIYKMALVHRSLSQSDAVAGKLNNERLEYLGDAVLGAITADFLFRKFPLAPEGQLTEMRSKIVCRANLNALSRKIGLDKQVIIDSHVHGKSVNFELNKLWIKNLTITTGLVNTNTTGMLLKTCCSGKLPLEKLATHHFKFNEFEKAYDVFKHASDEKALKVMIDYS